jgi:FMN reductase
MRAGSSAGALGPSSLPLSSTNRAQGPSERTEGSRRKPQGPLIVGLGGTEREGSVTEACLREALLGAERSGARVQLFSARSLELPMYNPTVSDRSEQAVALIEAVRECDGLVLGSPAYHGGLSGLVKNALDYLEDLHDDPRPYLDGRAVGCIVCAYGGQATATTLSSLRNIIHALRGWPTPLGVTVSSDSVRGSHGTVTDEHLRSRLRIMGQQVIEFAQARVV